MKLDRRTLLAGLALAALPDVAGAEGGGGPPAAAQDYAEARRGFRTNLLIRGPAPDEGESLRAPDGARAVRYGSGALELTAWISDPPPAKRSSPAVLFLHGGNALWHGHWDLTKPYREAGFLALMPALRAENGQPGAFSGFYDETDDVLAAARLLADQPGVDPGRIFLAGHSVGGTLTLLAALAAPLFRGAAAFSPNPDARAFFEHFPEDIRFDRSNPREFDMRSAAVFAASLKCPLLMLHGTEETRTETAIRLMATRASAAGKRAEHGSKEGGHTSAIPAETAESLRFFAAL